MALGTVDVVFGRVVGVHIVDTALIEGGKIDVLKLRPTESAQAVVQAAHAEVTGDLERLIERKPTGYRKVSKGIYGR